jgi:hypothetical protein
MAAGLLDTVAASPARRLHGRLGRSAWLDGLVNASRRAIQTTFASRLSETWLVDCRERRGKVDMLRIVPARDYQWI